MRKLKKFSSVLWNVTNTISNKLGSMFITFDHKNRHVFPFNGRSISGIEFKVKTTKMAVFRVVVPCSLVEVYQRFRGLCCLHHQGDEGTHPSLIALMTEAARSSETMVNFYQTTWHYNPEDSHLRTNRRENLKSCKVKIYEYQYIIDKHCSCF
jgi:hypothetical protein